ncbi:late embryogenesis abundant protein At1g64065 [Typha angustifolia]|uniref:late embryogenesis abundant protein At1g64065 n=1 Tax=Typha angustifolia TaxID=59011 RepID=UPI003C2E5AE4
MSSSDRDHVVPLAIATDQEDKTPPPSHPPLRPNSHRRPRRRRVLCCAAATIAVFAVIVAILVTVTFTVYKVKDPVMTMNSVSVKNLNVSNLLSANLTLLADVSVKNPNAAPFRFGPSTTALFYRANQVGQALGPPGIARAHGTVRMNVSVDVMAGRVLGDSGFAGDLTAGEVGVATSTRVGGRVRLFGVIKRHVDLEMNCSFAIDVSSVSIRNQSCWQHVWL